MYSSVTPFAPASSARTLALANTEYSFTIPSGVKRLTFQCRSSQLVRYAWEVGKVAGSIEPFISLKADMVFNEDMHIIKPRIIYFASPVGGVVMEFDYWF